MKLTNKTLLDIIDVIFDCEYCKHFLYCDGDTHNCFELNENKLEELTEKLETLFEVFK